MTAQETEKLASEGIAALMERLGPVRAIEFIRLCDQGLADYTAQRHEWLDEVTLDEVAATAKERDVVELRGSP